MDAHCDRDARDRSRSQSRAMQRGMRIPVRAPRMAHARIDRPVASHAHRDVLATPRGARAAARTTAIVPPRSFLVRKGPRAHPNANGCHANNPPSAAAIRPSVPSTAGSARSPRQRGLRPTPVALGSPIERVPRRGCWATWWRGRSRGGTHAHLRPRRFPPGDCDRTRKLAATPRCADPCCAGGPSQRGLRAGGSAGHRHLLASRSLGPKRVSPRRSRARGFLAHAQRGPGSPRRSWGASRRG